MNKKKITIIVIIIIILAILLGIYNIMSTYLIRKDGKTSNGKGDVINHIKSIEDDDKRKKQIDFAVKGNIITQKEADELY